MKDLASKTSNDLAEFLSLQIRMRSLICLSEDVAICLENLKNFHIEVGDSFRGIGDSFTVRNNPNTNFVSICGR